MQYLCTNSLKGTLMDEVKFSIQKRRVCSMARKLNDVWRTLFTAASLFVFYNIVTYILSSIQKAILDLPAWADMRNRL